MTHLIERLIKRGVLAVFVVILWSLPQPVEAQSPTPIPGAADLDEVIIRPGDVLRIRVWPAHELGGEFPVEHKGFAYLPIIGEFRAAGVSVYELRRALRERYGEVLKTPVVSVAPLVRVSVFGAVLRPGRYLIDPSQTLFDVIGLAGGFRPSAKDSEIRLLRDGQVVEVDARRAFETGENLLEVSLRSGDRIVVPQRGRSLLNLQNVYVFLQSALLVATLWNLSR